MKKIFIACPISKYLDGDVFIAEDFKTIVEKIYDICKKYAPEVFLALKREEYGKKLMTDICTELDFEEMKSSDLVVAIPEDSNGTAVELGWSSAMRKRLVLILDCNRRYTPLISGLGDITDVTIIWYEKELDEKVLHEVRKSLDSICGERGNLYE